MIILGILKTAGIVLLILAAILIVLILLVLFVPVRYNVTILKRRSSEGLDNASAEVSWLLRAFKGRFDLTGDRSFIIKIFGIRLHPDKFRSGNKKKKQKKQRDSIQETPVLPHDDLEENIYRSAGEKISETGTVKKAKRNIPKKAAGLINKLIGSVKHVFEMIISVIRFMWAEGNIEGILFMAGRAFGLLRKLLPKHIKGCIEFGTEDPCTTGQITAAGSVLWPLYGNELTVIPDFNNKVFEADVVINGYIRVISIVATALKIYFDRNSRNVIKYFIGRKK